MNKQVKKLRKEIKKLAKRFDPSDGLTLKTSYDTKLTLHKNSRDPEPLLTFSRKGEYSTPVIKLVLIVLLAVTGISIMIAMMTKAFEKLEASRLRSAMRRRDRGVGPDDCDCIYEDEDDEDSYSF